MKASALAHALVALVLLAPVSRAALLAGDVNIKFSSPNNPNNPNANNFIKAVAIAVSGNAAFTNTQGQCSASPTCNNAGISGSPCTVPSVANGVLCYTGATSGTNGIEVNANTATDEITLTSTVTQFLLPTATFTISNAVVGAWDGLYFVQTSNTCPISTWTTTAVGGIKTLTVNFGSPGLGDPPGVTPCSVTYQLRAICFPASSTVRRTVADDTWETVAVPDLRIGDTVECLVRDPAFGSDGSVTSAAYGRLGRCAVYGYKKAAATPAATYTRITYEGAGNDVGTVAMSPNHHLLDALTGQARQAGDLRAGDTVLRAGGSGALAPARVLSVATVQEAGAYVPLLSDGGLPVVDGVVAYPSSGESAVGLDAKHWGQYYLHAPLWQQAPPAAGKAPSALPGRGRTLSNLGAQQPVAVFTQKWYKVAEAAAQQGRSFCDWAGVAKEMHGAIAQGRQYTEGEALVVLDKHCKLPPGVSAA